MFKNLTIDKKFINESLSSNENIKGVVTISHGMADMEWQNICIDIPG